jgi:Zn-dependent protease
MNDMIAMLAIAALPIIFAITVHEAAHAWVARYFGDPTAAQAGRITLNPLTHIDPIGTLLLPALLFFLSGGKFAFGYAKPVPVNSDRLRHPKRDMLWVAAAGPFANLLMAVFWMFLLQHLPMLPVFPYSQALMEMSFCGVLINLTLMLLNLLPLPPLDGGRITTCLLPLKWAVPYARLGLYGMIIVIALLAIPARWLGLGGQSLWGTILFPMLEASFELLYSLF